ncbi:MAG: MFS transporter [Candidatus Moduliflexus flocculans]|nr:MFS transporter [Candidatus Moduliflexus flocculans]
MPLLIAVGFADVLRDGRHPLLGARGRRGREATPWAPPGPPTRSSSATSSGSTWSYWCIVALCVTFYSGIFPFQTFAVKFFIEAHGASRETGGFLSSMLTLFAMIFTPLFGLMVDKVGRRSLFMMCGSLLLIPVYLMMGYTSVSLYVPMAMMGMAFSLIPAIMWPSVAYVVEENKLGTAYGLMTLDPERRPGGLQPGRSGGPTTTRARARRTRPATGRACGSSRRLGFAAVLFSWLLWRAEKGPHAHGLETIKAG